MTNLIGRTKVVCDTGSTQANLLHIGSEGGLTHDYEYRSIRIHDGATPGGRLIREGAFRDVATGLGSPGDYLVPLSLIFNYLVPQNIIVQWWGTEANIPTGWVLCDGQNGTPDLRNRFIVGAGGTDSGGEYIPGQTGGSTTPTTDFEGFHAHTAVTDPGGGHLHVGNTNLNGDHIHSGNTASGGVHDHTVTVASANSPHDHNFTIDPASHSHSAVSSGGPVSVTHTHNAQSLTPGAATQTVWLDTTTTGGLTVIAATGSTSPPGGRPFAVNIPSNVHLHPTGNPIAGSDLASHTHLVNVTPSPGGSHTHPSTVIASDDGNPSRSTLHTHTASTGPAPGHTHSLSTSSSGSHLHSYVTNYEADHVHPVTTTSFQGDHQHTISDNRPPFMALCYIMFVGI